MNYDFYAQDTKKKTYIYMYKNNNIIRAAKLLDLLTPLIIG